MHPDETVCSVYMSGPKTVTAAFKARTKTCNGKVIPVTQNCPTQPLVTPDPAPEPPTTKNRGGGVPVPLGQSCPTYSFAVAASGGTSCRRRRARGSRSR